MRSLVKHWLGCCFLAGFAFVSYSLGDEPLSSNTSRSQRINQGLNAGDGPGGAVGGGGAIANYNSLINLIESTIDADWASQGGTATMVPYRNGVRIDAQGVIERLDPAKVSSPAIRIPSTKGDSASPAIVKLDDLGDWQEPSALRWVSLHQLDRQIAQRLEEANPRHASVSMEVLAGLYRIDYLALDKETNEWFIGGPAGNLVLNQKGDLLNAETGLPPVLLEDLLCVAPHVLAKQGEFGCTIDPNPKRLTDAYEMSKSSTSMRSLQRSPDRWVEQWRTKLGRQNAKVIGLRQDSPTGYALIIADAHMKRVGLELEHCPTPIKSYWQQKEIFGNSSRDAGMVRWWFSLTDHKIPMDPDRHIYHFASSNVQVLSEAQLMNSLGERVAATAPDIAADSFARDFTRHFDKLQQAYPVYGRLRHVFDLAVAMEIVRSEIQKGNGKDFLVLDEMSTQPRLEIAPQEIDSVAATHRMADGSISAIISGGVSIHLNDVSKRLKTDRLQTNRVAVESSNDGTKAVEAESVSSAEPKFWR